MANRGNLRVGLTITANTEQAKQQLNQLKSSLDSLSTPKGLENITKNLGIQTLNSDMRKAVESAGQLRSILENSTNKNGTLDIQDFSKNIKAAGMSLTDYHNDLARLGSVGQASFGQLANAIISAENPVKKTSKLVKDFTDTLYRAAKWQISQTVLRTTVGSIQTAYNYAQDLNESLTNIRIVTGRSSEEMAKFADNANRAAKALSASTLDYTDASLIYFQQGMVKTN